MRIAADGFCHVRSQDREAPRTVSPLLSRAHPAEEVTSWSYRSSSRRTRQPRTTKPA
jgi:hypothetical protein